MKKVKNSKLKEVKQEYFEALQDAVKIICQYLHVRPEKWENISLTKTDSPASAIHPSSSKCFTITLDSKQGTQHYRMVYSQFHSNDPNNVWSDAHFTVSRQGKRKNNASHQIGTLIDKDVLDKLITLQTHYLTLLHHRADQIKIEKNGKTIQQARKEVARVLPSHFRVKA